MIEAEPVDARGEGAAARAGDRDATTGGSRRRGGRAAGSFGPLLCSAFGLVGGTPVFERGKARFDLIYAADQGADITFQFGQDPGLLFQCSSEPVENVGKVQASQFLLWRRVGGHGLMVSGQTRVHATSVLYRGQANNRGPARWVLVR